jgi:DNA-binding CsgD family transcriptional regulator
MAVPIDEGPGRRWLLVERGVAGEADWRAERLGRALGLSRRQREALALLARGYANRALAARLGLSENTVESHVRALLARIGGRGRTALVAWFWTSRPE